MTHIMVQAENLRARRLGAYLTQDELADKSGVSLPKIKAIEAGTGNRVRPGTVRKLAEALECAPSDLGEIVDEVAS